MNKTTSSANSANEIDPKTTTTTSTPPTTTPPTITTWNDYITKVLIDSNHITQCIIFSCTSGQIYATSDPTFLPRTYPIDSYDSNHQPIQLFINELEGIINAAKHSWIAPPNGGLRFNGEKFTWLGSNEEILHFQFNKNEAQKIKYGKGQSGKDRSICLCNTRNGTMVVSVMDRRTEQKFSRCVQYSTRLVAYLESKGL